MQKWNKDQDSREQQLLCPAATFSKVTMFTEM